MKSCLQYLRITERTKSMSSIRCKVRHFATARLTWSYCRYKHFPKNTIRSEDRIPEDVDSGHPNTIADSIPLPDPHSAGNPEDTPVSGLKEIGKVVKPLTQPGQQRLLRREWSLQVRTHTDTSALHLPVTSFTHICAQVSLRFPTALPHLTLSGPPWHPVHRAVFMVQRLRATRPLSAPRPPGYPSWGLYHSRNRRRPQWGLGDNALFALEPSPRAERCACRWARGGPRGRARAQPSGRHPPRVLGVARASAEAGSAAPPCRVTAGASTRAATWCLPS